LADTVPIMTRVPAGYAQSIRRIAELRGSTVSDTVARILCEQVVPSTDADATAVQAA
jgi:hypothetical protein